MLHLIELKLDRNLKVTLNEQIYRAIKIAINKGNLPKGARLPSWRDLAAQLGVSRGTVRLVYEKLLADQLILSSKAKGTVVADLPSMPILNNDQHRQEVILPLQQQRGGYAPLPFQLGVSSKNAFPATLFTRIGAQQTRNQFAKAPAYPDPRGLYQLRSEIAGHLAITRGIQCNPTQIIITSGYSGGLGLVLMALGLENKKAWMEEPGYPLTRRGLELARLIIEPISVDNQGILVDEGIIKAPDAKLAIITPGQQAPLGMSLSLDRRLQILDWANQAQAWIIEDDYLSDLQLQGRAAPALASLDRTGRVIHIGSFSKTLTPSLRIGFVVAPLQKAALFAEVAMCLTSQPSVTTQLTVADFMHQGHYIRHLRRLKRLYAANRDIIIKHLSPSISNQSIAGLSAILPIQSQCNDVDISKECLTYGLAPSPLSTWYAGKNCRKGLLLGIASLAPNLINKSCEDLKKVLNKFELL
ncbi:MocR-like pyridoxine biosynthesis transcription factor PdxR [Bartonella sp. HY761]|uniref:MocR-like pyridoxine biosynthesis transcription factor PdxR n=1 Tax=Bartonella sp. HY761 TaxID=2979330 RepID=UPI00220A44C6|nr:PLP-dependent aminotransferase family protein [Bartonella sp. HY761]UXN05190.1 PLP-dependent aminotransferase family protein [Bartonella sp. HY761]